MIKKIDGYLLTSLINHKYLVKVRPFLACKSVDMLDYVKPIQRDLDPEAYVIHIGTNNLGTDKTPDESSRKYCVSYRSLKQIRIIYSSQLLFGGAKLIIQKLEK